MNTDPNNRQRSGVFEMSLKQVKEWLRVQWHKESGKQIPVVYVGNKDALRLAEYRISDESNEKTQVTYPFMVGGIVDISLNAEVGALRKNRSTGGYLTGRNMESGTAVLEDLRRTKVGLSFTFRTDDINDVITLAHIILYHAPRVGFVMKNANGFKIETSIDIEPSISFPVMNTDTPGDAFQYEFVLMLNTFIGYSSQTKLIKELTFNTVKDDSEEEFYAGSPYLDLSKNIYYTDYFDKNSPLYKGGQ